jgi:zinc transport system ATP-binding protein
LPTIDAATQTILDVEHLSVTLGSTPVLKDVTFRVGRGESVAVIGPNGAGKTVLFRALIGAIPVRGAVRWAEGVSIGYVPQKLDIARDVPLTGTDFLRAKAAIAGIRRTAITDAIGAVGLSAQVLTLPIGALSGGQFQRLLLAFALLGEPDVLLLDELTAGVDEPGQERLNELVARLRRDRGLTVLQISHDLSIVYGDVTTVLCLSRDHVCIGPPRTVLTPDLLQTIYGTPVGFHVHDHHA